MPWQQLDTVQHDFSALAGDDDLSLDLPTPPDFRQVRGSARFTFVNRGTASAYLLTAADVAAPILSAFEIPSGQTRISSVIDWPISATSGEYPQLHGLLGANVFVTPEVKYIP